MEGGLLLTGILVLFVFPAAASELDEINSEITDQEIVDMDMIVPPDTHEDSFFEPLQHSGKSPSQPSSPQHAAVKIEERLWSLPIPFEIHWSIDRSKRRVILEALSEITSKTCIKFRDRVPTDVDYIVFVGNKVGCYSYIGRITDRQIISMGPGCGTKRIAVHETKHALGFLHEQARPDRDNHVTIKWDNIKEGQNSQFRKAREDLYDSFGVDYDFKSVMHYKRYAFSSNGLPTIIRNDGSEEEFGQPAHGGLSEKDALQVKRLYKCDSKGEWSQWSTYGSCSETCGGGSRYAYRSCSGGVCEGDDRKSEECNTKECEGSGRSFSCFPEKAFVRNDKGVKVAMKDLSVGEKVLAMDDNGLPVYSPITMMLHREANRTTRDFVAITTNNGKRITMTSYHLIPLSTKEFVFAKDVKPGQNVTVFDQINNGFHFQEVVSVDTVTETGFYAPLSNEGTIVVNDVHVSCYALFPSHSISHLLFSIWRSLYANFETLLSQRTDTDGIHWYPSMLKSAATYFQIL